MTETFTDDDQELRTRTARLPPDDVAALAARYRGAPDGLWAWMLQELRARENPVTRPEATAARRRPVRRRPQHRARS
jgi:hypothetical protein